MNTSNKEKVVTILVVMATIMLGGVAIYTGIRLFQLRNQSVALNAPEKSLANGPSVRSCTILAFTLAGENSPTPTPSGSPTNSPTPNPTASLTPTTPASSNTPTPTQPASTPSNTPTPTTGNIAEISPTTPVYTSTPTPTISGSTGGRQTAQTTPTPGGETLMSSGVPEVTYIFGFLGVIGLILAISIII